jgi:hypothetical protein
LIRKVGADNLKPKKQVFDLHVDVNLEKNMIANFPRKI